MPTQTQIPILRLPSREELVNSLFKHENVTIPVEREGKKETWQVRIEVIGDESDSLLPQLFVVYGILSWGCGEALPVEGHLDYDRVSGYFVFR